MQKQYLLSKISWPRR